MGRSSSKYDVGFGRVLYHIPKKKITQIILTKKKLKTIFWWEKRIRNKRK